MNAVMQMAKPKGQAVSHVKTVAQTVSHEKTVDEFATSILGAWHRSIDGIIEAGELWARAKSALSKEELDELKAKTKFSDPTISKLIAIAEDPILTDPKFRAVLPNSYGTLYELKDWNTTDFEAAIEEGVLRPDIERDEVRTLRGKRSSGRQKAKAKRTVLVTILLSQDEIDPSDLDLLKSAVSSLFACRSVTVETSPAWERLL